MQKGGDRTRIFIWILHCMGSFFPLSAPDSDYYVIFEWDNYKNDLLLDL